MKKLRNSFKPLIKINLMNKKIMLILISCISAGILTYVNIPLQWGNPNLGTTPVSIVSIFTPLGGIITALVKGISSSIYTGRTYVEMAAGVGDALMALLTFYLVKKIGKEKAIIVGQFSRYIFTSTLVAISVSFFRDKNINEIPIIWIDMFPAITISIILNIVATIIILKIFGDKINNYLYSIHKETSS
ncbi:MAG: hypothetical protein AMQ22_00971 [Candidatus Methanofastidiosum methylothiophilum]|uniref:QueT transporter n=1 Tax=Candidatus Methanofastidiosum methylothiophilum TaxID=1705564 RepID=A0A150J4F4_9EURY|nr:MAG: hypothetical protein AMQ22_00971 [Candidatus Methanofastidiosum methylthiophilus]